MGELKENASWEIWRIPSLEARFCWWLEEPPRAGEPPKAHEPVEEAVTMVNALVSGSDIFAISMRTVFHDV